MAGTGSSATGERGGFDVGLNRSYSVGRAAGAFSPLDLPGLQLWLDAGTVNVSGGLLVSWPDLSGNSRTATQGIPGQRATVGVTAQNGFGVVSNNDPSEADPTRDNYGYPNISLTDWDIILVGKLLDNTLDQIVVGRTDANNQCLRLDAVNGKLITYDGTRSCSTSGPLPVALTSFSVHECARESNVVQFYQNGLPVTTVVDFGAPTATMVNNALWNLGGTPAVGQGFILSLLVYSRKLALDERAALVRFLRERFAI